MNTILVPTDYSTSAENATEYAIDLATQLGSKIILFHAYHLPIIAAEVPTPLVFDYEHIEKENLNRIQKAKNDIVFKHPTLRIDYELGVGFSGDEIISMAETKKPDLIVMGLRGMSAAEEFLIGSTSATIVRKANCPVLIVPEKARFIKLDTVVFACDYNEEFIDEVSWEKVKNFLKKFNSKVYVLTIVKPGELIHQVNASSKIKYHLDDIQHSLHFLQSDDVTEGIANFSKEKKADMLIMLPKRHNALGRIFHRSNTKKMIFHTDIPVLTVHTE